MNRTAKSECIRDWNRAWHGLLALAVLCGCIGTETTNPRGGASDTEPKPGLSGTLKDEAGIAVGGVTVKAFPEGLIGVEDAADVAADSAMTDARGRYHLAKLPQGTYNLIGQSGTRNLSVLIPRIHYPGPKYSLDIGVDSLRAPGQIQGSVTLGGKPQQGVFCSLPGTPYLSISDDHGSFLIANVPAGGYVLRYAGTGLATADSVVVVRAGAITMLNPKDLAP